MKRTLEIVGNEEASVEGGLHVSDGVYLVADGAQGDLALEVGLELVACFRQHGRQTVVAIHVPRLEPEYAEGLKERFVGAGAGTVCLAQELELLGEAVNGVTLGAIALLIGGSSLVAVTGGTRLVIRSTPSSLAAAKRVKALEASAHVVVGPSRRRFAEHYVRAVLGDS